MANSYARGMVFRRLSEISGLDINSNTVEIVSVKPSKNKHGNTELTLKANKDSFFKGHKVYFYDRKPMCQPIEELLVPIGDRKVAWTWELLDAIYQATGMRHLKEEIVNERTLGKSRVYIAFSEAHPYWLGGFYINLIDRLPETKVSLNQVLPTKRPATDLYEAVTFTDVADLLRSAKADQTLSERFREVLESKRKLGWVNQQKPSAFNLAGAKVSYNGPAAKIPVAKHKAMRLLQISLDPSKCTQAYGELMLYY